MELSEGITQIRAQLEHLLREPFSRSQWDSYGSIILLYTEGKLSFDGLLETIREVRASHIGIGSRRESVGPMRSIPSRDKTRTDPEPLSHPARQLLLSEIITNHANRDAKVKRCRDEGLGGILLEWSKIREWITQENEKERGLPGMFLDSIPVPPEHHVGIGPQGGLVPTPLLCVDEAHPAGSMHVEDLAYAIPENPWVHRTPVAHGGNLLRLARLSTEIAQRYRWSPAHATVFILTGLIPVLERFKATFNYSEFTVTQGRLTALSRIVLTIDPTHTADEVKNEYQHMRQCILGAGWRDLQDQQLQLAQFALQREDEEPWAKRMAAWNKDFEPYYKHVSNFKRDSLNALNKLLNPVLPETTLKNLFPANKGNDAETPGKL